MVSVEPEGEGDYYDLTVPGTHCYYDAQGILHHNSGKGWLSARFLAWVALVLCHLRVDPALLMGMGARSSIDCMNVAPDEKLARTVFFRYLKANLAHPLFARSAPEVRADRAVFRRPAPGGGTYEFLCLHSMHSRADGLEGRNLLVWVMDEADAFPAPEGVSVAQGIHDILRSSAASRTGRFWRGFGISYPRTRNGFLMTTFEHAEKDRERNDAASMYYTDLASTFEVRPSVSRDTPSIRDDFERDPRAASAMYDCLPMEGDDAFIEYPERVDQAVDHERAPCALWRPGETARTTALGQEFKHVSLVLEGLSRVPGRQYFLGGDAGKSGDLFCVSVFSTEGSADAYEWVCHWCNANYPDLCRRAVYEHQPLGTELFVPTKADLPRCGSCGELPGVWKMLPTDPPSVRAVVGQWRKRGGASQSRGITVDGREFRLPHVHEELVLTWTPHKARFPGDVNRTVDFVNAQAVCRELIQGLGITRARFDQWQSESIVQTLVAETGADVGVIGIGQQDQFRRGRLAKMLLYEGLITLLPYRHPVTGEARRDREWKQLQRKNERLDHPQNGSKDIWDAETIAIYLAATSQCAELELVLA